MDSSYLLPDIVKRYLPEWLVSLFERYVSFFLTGASGAMLNLGVTWLLTTYVFGIDQYFYGYAVGLGSNLVYNFVRHSLVTFQTRDGHWKRFAAFILYSLVMTGLQYVVVRNIVSLTGEQFYLLVIAGVIAVFSTVTFLVCNYWLFNESYF